MKIEVYCMRQVDGAECKSKMTVVATINMKTRLACKKCGNEVIVHA